MDNTAILVDGGFYRKRLEKEWKSCSPEKSAEVLLDYCKRHLVENGEIRSLYRIFYYDCPPVSKNVFDPLSNKTVNFGEKRWLRQDERLSERPEGKKEGRLETRLLG